MRYVSTRGSSPDLGFSDVLLSGLAADGGLYVPTAWPTLPDISAVHGYADVAATVMAPFVVGDGGVDRATLDRLCHESYATFRHPAVAPLTQLDDSHFLLELFHGPTLAFKDVALQLVGRLFDHVLAERGERVTIIGATSGDTGSAAIEGVRRCDNVDIVMLFPAGRISDVQRRQMTTVESPNVHAVAVDGTFDDCQDLVKAMFADQRLRAEVQLSAVNSINWARIMAQVVYYVTTARALRAPLTVTVPTGNFGNVLAGWIAKRMGAAIDDFVVASNTNDILARFVNDRDMSTREVVPTMSPSMDIQVSSNFERLLFEMSGRDGAMVTEQLTRFRSTGRLEIEADQHAEWIAPTFRATCVDDEATLAEIGHIHASTGILIDPHTATATAASRRLGRRDGGRTVSLATAHPAKFPDAVERATGLRPPLPEHLAALLEAPERSESLPNDVAAIADFVRRVAR